MGKRYMTLEDLYNFYFSQGKTQNFSCYANNGDVIVVQTPGNLKFEKNEALDGLYPTRVQMNFVGDNLNNSRIEMKAQKNALPSSHYRPLLAYIHEVDGEPQFYGHNMELDEDGNTVYLEQPVGVIAEEAHIEHDNEYDMDYAVAMGYIWEEYSQASYILDRDKECDVSVELSIRSLSYNAKDEILVLDDFYYSGCTILGVDDHGNKVNPAMPGSNITLKDFSTENNSVKFEKDDRIVELLQQLSDKIDNLSGYTKEDFREGGKTPMFEALLEKYGKTAEDINFDYSEMTDEELEAKFAELFADEGDDTESENLDDVATQVDGDDESTSASENNTEGNQANEDIAADTNDEIKKKIECSFVDGENVKTFSVSLSEVIYALSELVNETYADEGSYYGVEVFADDNYVIMQDYWTGKAYKQSFKKKKGCNSYTLSGDRIPVKAVFLTEDEEKALDDMRSKYTTLTEQFEEVSTKLNKYEEEPNKVEILNSAKYGYVANTEEFTELMNNHFDLSIDELTEKANDILLTYAEQGKLKFADVKNVEEKEIGAKHFASDKKKNSRYGNLFSK